MSSKMVNKDMSNLPLADTLSLHYFAYAGWCWFMLKVIPAVRRETQQQVIGILIVNF